MPLNRLFPNNRAITLIMTAAILAILAALGTGFFSMAVMSSRSAVRYSDSVRAEMMARAGISFAIAGLHAQAYKKTEDPTDPWYMVDYLHGAAKSISFPDSPLLHNGIDDDGDGDIDNLDEVSTDPSKNLPFSRALGNTVALNSDRFTLNVTDAASKININQCDNLAVVLDNLCRVVGPPLVAADQTMTYQRVWEWYGGLTGKNTADWPTGGGNAGTFPYGPVPRDLYYWLYDGNNNVVWNNYDPTLNGTGRPLVSDGTNSTNSKGNAVYGDGYAIAGYRAKNGKFLSINDVKRALTYVERSSPPDGVPGDPLERLEIEVKFAAIKDYITIDSWVDTNSVCTGKFEWVFDVSAGETYAVDRDKSWIPDDPVNDPQNKRGSLRGCYVSIVNGHGAGQLRRIKTNGVDWIKIAPFFDPVNGSTTTFTIMPGPTSSYMIMAQEDALLVASDGSGALQDVKRPRPYDIPDAGTNGVPKTGVVFPKTNPDGTLVDDPDIDYVAKPLCIHRSPININTVSDKVLAALFMGINVTQGNYLSVGTDADLRLLANGDANVGLNLNTNAITSGLRPRTTWNGTMPDWKIADYTTRPNEPYILTPKGIKRIPASYGSIVYDVPVGAETFQSWIESKLPVTYDMNYLNNYGLLDTGSTTDPVNYPGGTSKINEANELAYRIIIARQKPRAPDNTFYIDPDTGAPSTNGTNAWLRRPFVSWDDLYFRVIKPWDDSRINPTDSKGQQNIRYDPKRGSVARLIMAHCNPNADILKFNPNIEWIDRWGRNFTAMEPIMVYTNEPEVVTGGSLGHGVLDHDAATPANNPNTCDQDGFMKPDAIPMFSHERSRWEPGNSELFATGTYNTPPAYMGTYITRGFRYKADEMIDKTDLNRSTTEFCFDSGGIYDIQSAGTVVKGSEVLAERKMRALVQIYSVWRETTQRQFVQGKIQAGPSAPDMSSAAARGQTYSGQVTRDANPNNDGSNREFCLPLVTLPEPMVPLNYTISNKDGGGTEKNIEVVDTTLPSTGLKRDAWRNPVSITTPLIVANHVQPAGYDGQIILATNTLRYDPSGDGNDKGDMDTFLASFNGDLDTNTCKGNGHEQAKTPADCQIQVSDSIGLLGALNDTQIDMDPGLSGDAQASGNTAPPVTTDLPPYNGNPIEIWRFKTVMNALRGLNPNYYWNSVTCRQGDLRAEGLYVGSPGTAGNEGTIKYLCGIANNKPSDDPANYDLQNFSLNGKGAVRVTGETPNGGAGGYVSSMGSAGNVTGCLISMWAKTTWHHDDDHNHEFFDCSTPGWLRNGIRAEAFWLRKHGRSQFAVCEKTSQSGTITDTGSIKPFEDPAWGVSGAGNRMNDFGLVGEYEQDNGDWSDPDWTPYMHGGHSGVPADRVPESPVYRIQPFRWHFLGARVYLKQDFSNCIQDSAPKPYQNNYYTTRDYGLGKSGFWKTNGGSTDPDANWVATNLFRPFIDSERYPDGKDYKCEAKYWTVTQQQHSTGFISYQDKGRAGPIAKSGDGGQSVRWHWASPGGTSTADGKSIIDNVVFGMNNCNPGYNYENCKNFCSIYKSLPEDGTNAVIDEFKISRKETILRNPADPANDRVVRFNPASGTDDQDRPPEMTLSRYYLPPNPSDPAQCPTFTSQTMLQSLKGFDKIANGESIILARVTWSCFTPRFMAEYKHADGTFNWGETITDQITDTAGSAAGIGGSKVPFKGPFDYCKYNDIWTGPQNGLNTPELPPAPSFDDPSYNNDPTVFPYRCTRPSPDKYKAEGIFPEGQTQSTKGIEVELLDDTTVIAGSKETFPGSGIFVNTNTFTNPDSLNRFGTSNSAVTVMTDKLRYRVRFRYPVDHLADTGATPGAAGNYTVDPSKQYLLDTPVFDDISVTYFSRPRIIEYQEINE